MLNCYVKKNILTIRIKNHNNNGHMTDKMISMLKIKPVYMLFSAYI